MVVANLSLALAGMTLAHLETILTSLLEGKYIRWHNSTANMEAGSSPQNLLLPRSTKNRIDLV
jgi:hypothetical protein